MKGSVVSGDNAWNACGSGTAKLVVVERLHTISLGRVVLGTVRRPMGISTVLNLSWDTSCSGCEPGGQGKQDQLPCTPPG